MKVKIGNKVYNSELEPIMVILEGKDKENIQNMDPGCTMYCSYPEGRDPSEITKFMTEVRYPLAI